MPIPPFDGTLNTLPPHLGNRRDPSDVSPYQCTTEELCQCFATSSARTRLLHGLLDFRADLFSAGVHGFQWIVGSFVENIEAREGRDPADIDVATFAFTPENSASLEVVVVRGDIEIIDIDRIKDTYHVDHYLVPLDSHPKYLVEYTRYLFGLYSHRRDDKWKGILVIELCDQTLDNKARLALEGRP
jgi:hypothetical protein